MNKDNDLNHSGKWIVLALGTITNSFMVAAPFLCMPVLFKEIAVDINLSLVDLGTIWGIIPFAAILISLPGGLLVDHFGVKKSLVIGCLFTGLFGGLRGISNDLITLAVTTFFFSLFSSVASIAVHKIASIYFVTRQRGLAQGIVSAGLGIGSMIGASISASVLSPLLGGWRSVFYLYGALSILVSIIWLYIKIPHFHQQPSACSMPLTFTQSLKKVVKIRDVWILGLVILGYNACFQGILGYIPLFLRNIGWTPNSADLALAVLPATSILVTIPITFLSDRFGSRRGILIIILVVCMICTGLLAIIRGPFIWILCGLIGMGRDSFTAISMAMNYEIDEVDANNVATAMGLVNSLSRAGAIIAPSIGNSLASIDPGFPFLPWAASVAISFVVFFMKKPHPR